MKSFVIFLWLGISLFATENIPSWYFNPPADDERFWYGVGEGSSLRQAKDDALADIASKLSVTISSKVSKDARQSTSGSLSIYYQTVNVNLESEVKKISFNNFEVVSTAQPELKSLALVKVEKEKFLKDQLQVLRDTIDELDRLQLESSHKSILEKFQKFQATLPKVEKSKTILSILTSFAVEFERGEVSKKLVDFYALTDGLRSKIEFYISANNSSQYNADILRESLSAEKIKIVKNLNFNNNNLVIVDLDTKTTDKQIYGSYMTGTRTTVSLKSKDGIILSTFVVEASGVSSLNQLSALKNASNNFKTQIDKKGVLAFLGIN